MKKNSKKSDFGAVEMVRKIRNAHYEKMKEKTLSERLAFIHKEAEQVNKKLLHPVH